MSLWTLGAADLLGRTASADPTPGGGSVSAISGTLGLGLVLMALEITLRRHHAPPEAAPLLARGTALLEQLKTHPDEDVRAFDGYMEALGLPKADSEQKEARRKAIQAAGMAATAAPLAAAADLLLALELAESAAPLAHQNVVSDVGAGAYLLGGALQATLLNVDINLGSLPAEQRDSALAKRQELAAKGHQATDRVVRLVAERLAR